MTRPRQWWVVVCCLGRTWLQTAQHCSELISFVLAWTGLASTHNWLVGSEFHGGQGGAKRGGKCWWCVTRPLSLSPMIRILHFHCGRADVRTAGRACSQFDCDCAHFFLDFFPSRIHGVQTTAASAAATRAAPRRDSTNKTAQRSGWASLFLPHVGCRTVKVDLLKREGEEKPRLHSVESIELGL